jgi:hypothetical protein
MIAGVMTRKLKTYQTSLGFFDQAIRGAVNEGSLGSLGRRQRQLQRRRQHSKRPSRSMSA